MTKIFISVILNSFQDLILKQTRCRNKFGMTRRAKGFTLIELLVVIVIVGILAGFIMANFIGVRQRGRDGVRKSDLRQIQSALELWRSDQGNYPAGLSSCGSSMITGGVTYMKRIPCDPQSATDYDYEASSLSAGYCLRACLENLDDAERDELPSKYGSNNPSIGVCLTLSSCVGVTESFTLQNP